VAAQVAVVVVAGLEFGLVIVVVVGVHLERQQLSQHDELLD
jgi:hypothetical protein